MSLIYISLCFLSFILKNKIKWSFQILLIIFLTLVATFRDSSLPDYETYYNFIAYNTVDNRLEPSISLIRDFSIILSDSVYLFFFIYAIIAIIIKFIAINRLTEYTLLSIIVYLSIDFPLHEMIQIRAAIAIGFALLCLPYIYEKKLVPFVIITAISITFHYSSLLLIPLYFLNTQSINKKRELTILILCFIIGVLKLSISILIEHIPINFINYLFQMYKNSTDNSDDSNILSITALFLFFLQLIMIWKVNLISVHNKYVYLLIKIQTISICSFFLLSDIPTVSGRISEFYRFAFVISIPFLSVVFKQKILGILFVVLVSSIFYIRILTLYYL